MKKILLCVLGLFVLTISGFTTYKSLKQQSNFNALLTWTMAMAAGEDGLSGGESVYSCTVTSNCYSGLTVDGSISCTGRTCARGFESGLLGLGGKTYVECDGNKTYC